MKRFLTIILLIYTLVISCNNSLGSGTGGIDAAAATSTAGKGIITCLVDGQPKSFTVNQSFFEISLGVDTNGAKDGLEILDGNAKKEGFQFEFKKSGTTKIKNDATGDMNCIINYYNTSGVVYTGEDVTVIVTAHNQHQLSGTFSGKLAKVYDDGGSKIAKNYPRYIQITKGKFDLEK